MVPRSVARGTTTRHSLAILSAMVGQVGGTIIHVIVEGQGGALGPGDRASSLVTRGVAPSLALIAASLWYRHLL